MHAAHACSACVLQMHMSEHEEQNTSFHHSRRFSNPKEKFPRASGRLLDCHYDREQLSLATEPRREKSAMAKKISEVASGLWRVNKNKHYAIYKSK